MYLSALVMGLVSNFHCLGMCGPIALMVPVVGESNTSRWLSVLVYNLGRIMTYGVLGLLFGFFGYGLSLAGIQQPLSIALGSLIILVALLQHFYPKLKGMKIPGIGVFTKLKSAFHKRFQKRSYQSNFILGSLNGLLPCGMVYLALVGSIATGDALNGMFFMMMFGLGTVPVMLFTPLFKEFLMRKTKIQFSKVVFVFALCFGSLLILRGADLGIPYVSPKADIPGSCCHAKNQTVEQEITPSCH